MGAVVCIMCGVIDRGGVIYVCVVVCGAGGSEQTLYLEKTAR